MAEISMGFNQNQKLMETPLIDDSAILANGASDLLKITPPEGYLGRITTLGMFAPAVSGAASGQHSFTIFAGSNVNMRVLSITGAYNISLQALGLSVLSGTPVPLSDVAVSNNLEGLVFSHNSPLTIRYGNFTNVTQSGTRSLDIQYLLEAETEF